MLLRAIQFILTLMYALVRTTSCGLTWTWTVTSTAFANVAGSIKNRAGAFGNHRQFHKEEIRRNKLQNGRSIYKTRCVVHRGKFLRTTDNAGGESESKSAGGTIAPSQPPASRISTSTSITSATLAAAQVQASFHLSTTTTTTVIASTDDTAATTSSSTTLSPFGSSSGFGFASHPPAATLQTKEAMQLTSGLFEEHRPKIIDSIRRSLFVAFDLEFSGVGKPKDGTRPPYRTKQTLQEQYHALKEGVEMYQVLQLGLCPVEWCDESNEYIASPMNLYVSPIVTNQSLNVDRVFSLQGSALEFLLDHGFDFNKQLRFGVPYLTREEEKRILETRAAEEAGQRELAPIEPHSQQFAEDCIKALEEWENNPDAPWDFFNITTERNTMSSYQRLLVHQIVRTRFPNLTSTSRSTFVCVTRNNAVSAASQRQFDRTKFDQTFDQAIGLRHIIDELFSPQRPDKQKIVLVGHNLLVDLLHLYNCFIGKLPDKVGDFAELIHTSFPIVVDTKYMATTGNGEDGPTANSGSTLQLLWSLLRFQENPKLVCHPDYRGYEGGTESYHEAGFDAFLTARVLVKMAARFVHDRQPAETPTTPTKANGEVDYDESAMDCVERAPTPEEKTMDGQGKGGRKVKTFSLQPEVDVAFPDNVHRLPEFYEFKPIYGETSDEEETRMNDLEINSFWAGYVNRLKTFNTLEGLMELKSQVGK